MTLPEQPTVATEVSPRVPMGSEEMLQRLDEMGESELALRAREAINHNRPTKVARMASRIVSKLVGLSSVDEDYGA